MSIEQCFVLSSPLVLLELDSLTGGERGRRNGKPCVCICNILFAVLQLL